MTWVERCELLLKDELTTLDIQKILKVKHGKARDIREEIVATNLEKNIRLANDMLIPPELLLEHIGKSYSYFENQAKREVRLNKLKGETNERNINNQ